MEIEMRNQVEVEIEVEMEIEMEVEMETGIPIEKRNPSIPKRKRDRL